ncbi:probable JmjC domain-containing histone demethylation protein 2C isoform X2 [Pristis pectinata]|uniref:probable JmjC domain-containing histone demethylation protein 2C isoform X2 n=1 Tax=Pristis pectinata TaxID=685728 RepID=UPI00223CEAA5|nr:probable JmjC domain-containing histone demethylation protein 2C isoform X2 [Pristis pectinata]
MFKPGLRLSLNERRLTPLQLEKRPHGVGQAVPPGGHFECVDPAPSLCSTMIVVNDKIPDARSVEPTLIQGTVLGDEGPSPCDGCSTYRATSHRRSQGDSHRQFTSPPVNCHSSFPRQTPEQRSSNNNGRGSPSEFSANHSREGNQYSEGVEMKNHKRKLYDGEENDINLPKLPRTTHSSSARLENGHVRFPKGTEQQARKETLLPGHKDPKGTEEVGRVAHDGSSQSKTSHREEQYGGNLGAQENPSKHYHNGKRELKSSCSTYEKGLAQGSLTDNDKVSLHKNPTTFRDHLEDLGRAPLLFPVHSISKASSGNWRDTNRLFIGKEGQKMDVLKGPLQSSFDYQGSHSSKFKSKESLGMANRLDYNELPAHKERNAADALCKGSTCDNGQKFGFQHPSPKANNADASKKTLVLNKSDPSPLYNGSGVLEATWHPFYSAPASSEISGPQLVSYVTTGAGSSTYSPLHAHFPHFLSGSLPVGHQSSLSSLLALNPQLDSTYGSSLGPLASTYSCYHPKHLQASSQAPLTAAYGHLSLYPTLWQNVNIDIHSGSRLSAGHQGYVNGEPTFNMGFPNPWPLHQSQKSVADGQPELGQYSSLSNTKELAASSGLKANSTYVYKGDVNGTRMYGHFLHPFPHGLGKVEVQNAPCSKVGMQPIPEEQLYKEVAFKQDLESDGPAEAHNGKRDNTSIIAEATDGKPLSLVLRKEQKTKSGEPPLVSPNLRPASSSKESSTSSSGFTLLNHSPDFSRKMGSTTQHQQLIIDENQRGLTLETTSSYSAVNGASLQHPPFHRSPRESGPKVKDQYIQYQSPLTLLPVNSSDNKNNFRDLSHGHFEQKNDVPNVLALPLSLATSMEVHHPSQLPLIMPMSKPPDITKILSLIPKDIANKDSNGNSKHGRLETEKTNHLLGIHNKVSVHNQIPSTPCLPAAEKQITVVPQMELGGKIGQGTYSTITCIDNRHQETNIDCNPSNKEHCSNSPTPMPSSQGLAEHTYNLSPLKGTVNTKRILQVTNAPDYYTPKKYKAARAATPCPMKLANESPTSVGEIQTIDVKRDTNSPKVPSANVSPVKPASGQDAFNASLSLQSNSHNYHTKLKKAWLTRHSEQDTMKDQHGKDVNGTASGQSVSKRQGAEPAVLASNSKQPEESERDPSAKRNSDCERGDLAESRHWLRARREAKLNNQHKSGQDLGEKVVKNNSKTKEEEDLKGTRKLENENSNKQNDRLDVPASKEPPKPTLLKGSGESFLQDVPCTELFTNIPRCRDCWPSRSRKGQESPPLSCFCRFMHLRRLSVGRNGGLKVEGFSTEDQINEETPMESSTSAAETGLDSDTSAYILGHVGDLFCGLMLSERGLLERVAKSYDGAIACKAPNGEKEERCDSCHSVVFNLHWVCPRCGFFVCMDCYNLKQKKNTRNEKERGEDFTAWLKCAKGHNHDIKSLRPTQLVPNTALVSLCEKMHRGKSRLGIKSNCTCVDGDKNRVNKAAAVNKSPKPQAEAKVEWTNSPTSGDKSAKTRSTYEHSRGSNSNHSCSQSPLHWLAELATRKAKEEANEAEEVPDDRPRSTSSIRPADQESKSVEHCSTLCDLLTTTAGKLRLGSTDAGIAFAPVYTTLNSCNMASRSMPSILDDIIASVVEKKIPITKTPRQSTEDQPGKMSQDKESDPVPIQNQEQSSAIHYSWLAKGTYPWIQDPTNKNNWKFFQEYWIKGLPVLVSGVLTATDSNSWGPECLRQDLGEQSVSLVNCRDHSVLTRARSKEFWEGFKTNSNCHRLKGRSSKILRLDYCASEKEFSEQMPAQFEELHRHLPLPEYTRNDGKLNLVSRFPEETAKSQLELRVCSVYGLSLDDGNKGSTSLHLELTDTLHILVHVEPPKEDRDTLEKVLASLERDTVDDAVIKRLRDPNERPGALWHIYTSQDTERIKEFLQKVVKEGDAEGQDQVPIQSCYLDQSLRTRLLEESGIRGRAVLQFRGDAVLIPTATTYQVQYFTSCISVTKQFVSPEHIKHSFTSWALTRENKPLMQHTHKLQMKSILYDTVKDCVETLAATSLG